MKVRVVLLLIIALLVGACAEGQRAIEPPVIRYGEDQCAECGMIISDARFAAGYLHEVSAGRYVSLIFDDIGDMLHHADKNPTHRIQAWYVHDYADETWLDATAAFYVISQEIHTPMGHGIAAHGEREAAVALATATNGELVDWAGLQLHFESGGMAHSHSH